MAIASQMMELNGQLPVWIATTDIDEVVTRLSTNPQHDTVYDVGDFATMYTRLDHTELKVAILGLHDFVLTWLSERYKRSDIVLDTTCGTWSEDNTDDPTRLGRGALARLLDDVIDNTYIVTGGNIYRQSVGIPMGGPASPELAILYCSYRELLHVRSARTTLRGIRWIDGIMLARKATEPSVLQLID